MATSGSKNVVDWDDDHCEYDDYLRRKVEVARRQRDAGLHFSNEEVEAAAVVRRVELLRRTGGDTEL